MWSRVQTVTSVSGCSGAETHFSLAYLLSVSCSYFVKHLDGVTAAAVAAVAAARQRNNTAATTEERKWNEVVHIKLDYEMNAVR